MGLVPLRTGVMLNTPKHVEAALRLLNEATSGRSDLFVFAEMCMYDNVDVFLSADWDETFNASRDEIVVVELEDQVCGVPTLLP